jgi:hypothetical protein
MKVEKNVKIRKNQNNQENSRKTKHFVAPSLSSMPFDHYFVAPSTFRVAAVYRVFLHEERVLRRK